MARTTAAPATVPLIATTPYAYATRNLQAGDRFDASPNDATLLKFIKRAVDAPPPTPEPNPAPAMVARDQAPVDAAPEHTTDDEDDPPKRRGSRYARRDLNPKPA